jgi:excisionase family DNA binding protein
MGEGPTAKVDGSKMLDVNGAANYLGMSTSFVRNLVVQRSVPHYKLGKRVMFRREDIDRFVDENKRGHADEVAWQLQGRRGKSPRTSARETPRSARSKLSKPRKPSKQEVADRRWTISEFSEQWYGVDSTMNLLQRAGITLTSDGTGQETFRNGDLVTWMEANTTEFERWLQEFDPVFKPRQSETEGQH